MMVRAAAGARISSLDSSAASRRDKLLGISPPAMRSEALGSGEELDEEDVWAAGVSAEDVEKTPPPQPPPAPAILISNGRRSWLEGGLGLSSLARGAASVSRVTSSSRMIPQFAAAAAASGASPASPSTSSSASTSSTGKGLMMMQSAPVNVPDWSKLRRFEQQRERRQQQMDGGFEVEDLEEEEEEEEERLPPHILVARSQATTFSVFEGAGRTLKGRDLSRVRNAVLKQTGFL